MHEQTLRLVYSNISYWIISGGIFSALFVLMLYTRAFLFFEPYLVFHIPQGMLPNFVLILALSGLIALVTALSVYRIRLIKSSSRKAGAGMLGSMLGVGAGICSSCGGIGMSIISVFGVAGVTALSFLNQYEIPIRLVAIGILIGTYFMTVRGLSRDCSLVQQDI